MHQIICRQTIQYFGVTITTTYYYYYYCYYYYLDN